MLALLTLATLLISDVGLNKSVFLDAFVLQESPLYKSVSKHNKLTENFNRHGNSSSNESAQNGLMATKSGKAIRNVSNTDEKHFSKLLKAIRPNYFFHQIPSITFEQIAKNTTDWHRRSVLSTRRNSAAHNNVRFRQQLQQKEKIIVNQQTRNNNNKEQSAPQLICFVFPPNSHKQILSHQSIDRRRFHNII